MKSFFGICVLSAFVAVGITQPTYNTPHHDSWQIQHHTQPEYHMSQPELQMSEPEHYLSQHQHHIMTQPEHHISQPNHYLSQPQHGYESWSAAETQAHAQPQPTWISPEQPPFQPDEVLSQPHIIHAQPHIIHSQPQPIDPQFELHPYPYQHPHYPPIESHHTQDTGPLYPTRGWNTQNPAVVYQHPLPEASAPEHINSFKEDYPNQASAFANAVASPNSVPVSNHEPANPHLYKIISIPKADNGADYIMPVADHETRQPKVIHIPNDEGLSSIVQEILAKYRHIPIKIKPESKPDNAPSPKERKSEGHGPVHRPHKYKKHKVPTMPMETKQSAKTEAVAKTDTDKTSTIITKHSTATKAPLKHKHKHSHKKVLKPLLDPELLAKELKLLSKELSVPDTTHKKDIPVDDNPIVTDDCTNPDDANRDNGLNSLDKNKPNNKHHHKKNSDPYIPADTTSEKEMPEKTTTPSTYIEPDDKKDQEDANKDTNRVTASLDETTEPCDDDNAPEKEDNRSKHEPQTIINEKQNTNLKPVDPQIENNDLKEKETEQKKETIKELTKKVEAKKEEKIEQSLKYVPEMKKYYGKQNPKDDQKDAGKDNDWVSASLDVTTESCDDDKAAEKENEGKKHVPIPKKDEKPKHDSDKNKPNNTPHHHDNHSHPHTPTEKDIAKTTTPSSNVKPSDQKYADRDNDFDSINSDETTEPYDTDNAPKKEDNTKKLLPKPKRVVQKYTNPKPLDNNTGNINAKPDHNIVQKKEVKQELTKKVEAKKEEKIEQTLKYVPEMKIYNSKLDHKVVQKKEVKQEKEEIKEIKEETVQQSKTNKQQLEPYNEKQKSIEQGTPVSDECEGSVTHVPYDKIITPGNKEEVIKPLPKARKDDNKPVSPHTDKGDTDIIVAKKDMKKVEQTKEVTRKVKTKKEDKIYQTMNNVPEPKKYKDKLKPEKQENKPSDIEDYDSPDSNKSQRPFDKTPAPEHKKELKEPLPKANKDNKRSKDPTNEKKIVDKKEVTEKVEIKTEKSMKKVESSEAVDKSKAVVNSNENSDIDDCDSADADTDPKLDITKTIKEKHDALKKKIAENDKKKATIAEGATGEEFTSDEVAEILEKTETDQPLSTVGFLFSLISHALQGRESVKQMFEEPKVKTFVKGIIPLFHEKQKEDTV